MSLLALLIAAQITNVVDARDENHPLGIDVELTWAHLRSDTTISRERTTASGIQLGNELQHTRKLDALQLRVAVALSHDVELHVIAPYALWDAQDWSALPGGTLATNTISISGCGAPGSCTTIQPIGAVPGRSRRSGFLDPTIGIAWSPISEERETSLRPGLYPELSGVATWAIGIDYTVPAGGRVDDPTLALAGTGRPDERLAHVVTAWTAFSRRLGMLDPYLKLEGSAPFVPAKAYDNCRYPGLLADVAAVNCAGSWKGETGYRPAFEAAVTAGTEVVAFEDRTTDRRFSVDVRGGVRWHGPSRGYTQVTDLLGKLTYAEQYLTATGQVAVYGRIAHWLRLRVAGLVGRDSAHFLTSENIGEDKNGDGQVTISQGTGAVAPDQNPNYDFRLDQPGHRLRAEPSLFWGVSGTLAITF